MKTEAEITIQKVFIANRGEICRRIAQTARYLGIQSVSIDETDTAKAFLAAALDEVIYVDNCQPIFTDGDRLIALAKKNGADAIHPGFGFLSENSDFAEKVIASGLIWIGPSPQSMRAMAEKSEAKALAKKSGLHCIEGLNDVTLEHDAEATIQKVKLWAKEVGYPLLMKASAGGGGRGMYLAENESELETALRRCYEEGLKAYGSGRMVVERYLPVSRHVEVQILGDQHGFVCVIGDRDCSVQRRRQKIIEEAPAPFLHPDTRRDLHEQALKLARQVNYYSAGTVEFILDWADPKAVNKAYFLEMNTRLQVEHPVSEEVYGIDLVKWQFKVACKHKLPQDFAKLTPRAHAVEGRLYGEDPANNFFPAPGLIHGFYPQQGHRLRWEIGLDTVDEVSEKFDPMIAKIICTGETREEAMTLMHQCLGKTQIIGAASNKEYLQYLVTHEPFLRRGASSVFVNEDGPKILANIATQRSAKKADADKIIAELFNHLSNELSSTPMGSQANPYHEISAQAFYSKRPTSARPAELEPSIPKGSSKVDTKLRLFDLKRRRRDGWRYLSGSGLLLSEEQGGTQSFNFQLSQSADLDRIDLQFSGLAFYEEKRRKTRRQAHSVESAAQSNSLTAAVPARVIRLLVDSGMVVESGQAVMVLESMKMEYELKATHRAKIAEIAVKLGDQVRSGQILCRFESA